MEEKKFFNMKKKKNIISSYLESYGFLIPSNKIYGGLESV